MRTYQWVSHDEPHVSLGPKYQCFSWPHCSALLRLQISLLLVSPLATSRDNQGTDVDAATLLNDTWNSITGFTHLATSSNFFASILLFWV